MSTRALTAIIAAGAVVPLIVLLWLGLRLREQDRWLAGQQAAQRVERSADIVVAALQRSVAASRQRLAAGATDWPPGGVAVTIGPSMVTTTPRGRLAWLPQPPVLPEAAASVVARGEELEIQKGDLAGAEACYRELVRSALPTDRAAGAVRLARVLRARGRTADAIETWRLLDGIDGAAIDGVPASLVGLHARAELLTSAGRKVEAQLLSGQIEHGFSAGRWLVSRPVYSLYAVRPLPDQESLASAAAEMYGRWKQRPPDSTGSAALATNGGEISVIYESSGGVIRALFATPAFVESQWLAPAKAAADSQGVRVALTGGAESMVKGTKAALRKAADAGLPWNVAVSAADGSAELAQLARRETLLGMGFLLLAVFTLATALLTIRGLNREWRLARLQSEFVSAVSHEFRTPLTSLRQFTDMLRDGRELSEQRRQLCYDAQARAGERLTRLVESLLDFSRLEAGARPYRMERCQVDGIIAAVLRDFAGEPALAGHPIRLSGESSSWVQADSDALRRAVWNLLDNAAKYSPGAEAIDVCLERRNGRVAISVRDRGIGIPKHEQKVIFTRFRRGAEAGRLGIQGTGIGLAMVDHIVRAHQGTIDVESEPGKGSCFTILIPAME